MTDYPTFQPNDYSVSIKHRNHGEKPWQWNINVAGKSKSMMQSGFYTTMSEAMKAGKAALAEVRAKCDLSDGEPAAEAFKRLNS